MVEQEPEKSFGELPTLDVIYPSHHAYVSFDLSSIAYEIRTIQAPLKVKLLLFVHWAEQVGSALKAEVVKLPSPV